MILLQFVSDKGKYYPNTCFRMAGKTALMFGFEGTRKISPGIIQLKINLFETQEKNVHVLILRVHVQCAYKCLVYSPENVIVNTQEGCINTYRR
jgi:hypothetical protein